MSGHLTDQQLRLREHLRRKKGSFTPQEQRATMDPGIVREIDAQQSIADAKLQSLRQPSVTLPTDAPTTDERDIPKSSDPLADLFE